MDLKDILGAFEDFVAYTKTDEYVTKNKISEQRCCTCKIIKSVDNFRKNKYMSAGYDIRCKACRAKDYSQRKDTFLKAVNRWKKEHSDIAHKIAIISRHKRQARKRNLKNTYKLNEWLFCLEYFEYRCAVCNREETISIKIVPDHWVALADTRQDNPGTVAHNIVPLCHGINGCNNRKGAKDATNWLKTWRSDWLLILNKINDYFKIVKTT